MPFFIESKLLLTKRADERSDKLKRLEMIKKRYVLLLTEEQEEKLGFRTKSLGFTKKSDYIRFMSLMDLTFLEKINQIHKEVCLKNDGKNTKKKQNIYI